MDVTEDEQAFMRDDLWNAWLTVDGVTVAFARFQYTPKQSDGKENRDAGCWLYDIETREGYRNKGYSKMLLKMIADEYGFDSVCHDGGYTPEGWDYIHKYLDNPRQYGTPVTGPKFSPQNFVYDWEDRIPLFD